VPSIANRLPGAFVAAGGLILVLYIVPNHTEPVDYGWMRPQTLPMICGAALVLLGILNALLPGAPAGFSVGEVNRAGLTLNTGRRVSTSAISNCLTGCRLCPSPSVPWRCPKFFGGLPG